MILNSSLTIVKISRICFLLPSLHLVIYLYGQEIVRVEENIRSRRGMMWVSMEMRETETNMFVGQHFCTKYIAYVLSGILVFFVILIGENDE